VRIALLADIHANLPALEAVVADLDARADVEAVYHLGDLVGYAPWPDETVTLLAQREIAGIAGNYDSTVAVDYPHCGCRYEDPRQEELSHQSFEWTKAHVSKETRRRLVTLPFRLDVRAEGGHTSRAQAILVHGTPTLNTLYWDADRSEEFCRKMIRAAAARPGDLIACGHTHVPWQREVDGVHLLNAGSVGRPKDGDPRSSYALVTLGKDAPEIEIVRVAYDVERAARGIRDSDLPDELANHLETGGTPRRGGGDG
jgi:putative phosphoesterase